MTVHGPQDLARITVQTFQRHLDHLPDPPPRTPLRPPRPRHLRPAPLEPCDGASSYSSTSTSEDPSSTSEYGRETIFHEHDPKRKEGTRLLVTKTCTNISNYDTKHLHLRYDHLHIRYDPRQDDTIPLTVQTFQTCHKVSYGVVFL